METLEMELGLGLGIGILGFFRIEVDTKRSIVDQSQHLVKASFFLYFPHVMDIYVICMEWNGYLNELDWYLNGWLSFDAWIE